MAVVLCGAILIGLLCLASAQSDKCGTSVAPVDTHKGPISQGQYPWMAALYLLDHEEKWIQYCSGALLSPRFVITAAHCLVFEGDVLKPEKIKVGLGKIYKDFYQNEEHSVIANVSEVSVHERYVGTATSFALDVGLIKLSTAVEVSDYILPACVDLDTTTVSNGATVHAAGWGTSENGTSTDRAVAADFSYLDYQGCVMKIRAVYQKFLTPDKICSLSINGSKIDRSDAGGALTYHENGRQFIVGILSTRIIDDTTFAISTNISAPEIKFWIKERLVNPN